MLFLVLKTAHKEQSAARSQQGRENMMLLSWLQQNGKIANSRAEAGGARPDWGKGQPANNPQPQPASTQGPQLHRMFCWWGRGRAQRGSSRLSHVAACTAPGEEKCVPPLVAVLIHRKLRHKAIVFSKAGNVSGLINISLSSLPDVY